MSDSLKTVLASFENIEAVNFALTGLRQAGIQHTTVYSPVWNDELQKGLTKREGPLGFVALGGALTGIAVGLSWTIGTATQHPMITGGQPIVSLPPFFVISFELAILFGVIATVLGMFWGIARNRMNPKIYDEHFSADRFGLQVVCDDSQSASVKNLMSRAGATEVRDENL